MRRMRAHCGVTLIELAITIALVGILAVIIVQFVQPVRSYLDSSRRAGLADTADTALRRIGRDVRLALPNSVRVTSAGGVEYLEFLLVRTGGRYRAEVDTGATNTCPTGGDATPAEDVLNFGAADTCFKTIGTPDFTGVTTSDFVVVYNLQPGTASGADAYQVAGTGGNKAQLVSAAGTLVKFASNTFSFESPGNRFFIIEGPVTYACNTTAGTLTRYWGYTISSAQPTPPDTLPTLGGGSSALMAGNVSVCSFTYDAISAGAGLVTMRLSLTMQGSLGAETASLYHAVHVNNVP